MIRRIVTRLIIANLIPMGIKAAQKAFRKKKPARVESKGHAHNVDKSSNDDFIEMDDVTETPQQEVTDKGLN